MNNRNIKRINKRIILTSFIKPLTRKGWHITGYFHDSGYETTPACCYKFWVDELPRILFSIWIYKGKPLCFGEDYLSIDKFRPSRCRNFETWQDFHESFIGYKNGTKSWKSVIQDEFGNCIYGYEKLNNEEFLHKYNEEYDEYIFSKSHGYLNYKEWDNLQNHLNKIIPILKEHKYVQTICMETGLPFFKDWCTIQVFYSDESYNLSDEEFDKLYEELREITILDENGKHVTGISFGIVWIEGRTKRTWEDIKEYLSPDHRRYRENTKIEWIKGSIEDLHD